MEVGERGEPQAGAQAAATFLVIVDDTPEFGKALRFAALRALHTGGEVALLRIIRPAQFLQWGRVQDAIEEDAEAEAAQKLELAASEVFELLGRRPQTFVRRGKPAEEVLAFVTEHPGVRALVLAAAPRGRPGPLVDFFAGERAGSLPCLVMIVPGGIADPALDRLT